MWTPATLPKSCACQEVQGYIGSQTFDKNLVLASVIHVLASVIRVLDSVIRVLDSVIRVLDSVICVSLPLTSRDFPLL